MEAGGQIDWVDWAQILSAIGSTGALVWAILQFRFESRRRYAAQREADSDRLAAETAAIDARKIEIYQRLEIESNRVFEFEARHPQLVPVMKQRLAPVSDMTDIVVQNEFGDRMNAGQISMIARKYYEMNCNLFEIASRLRTLELVDHDVFGSWVAWYFDTATEWGFRALWHDLRDNYTADLRAIFDGICTELIELWDVPHAAGNFAHGDANGCVRDEELEARRTVFYARIGDRFDCPAIRGWLEQIKQTQLPIKHPLAYG